MTQMLAKYRAKVISGHPIQKFTVKIDNCRVIVESNRQELIIQIYGRSGEEKVSKLFDELECLIFFYLGSFPLMELFYINEKEIDISKRAVKYETSDNFLKDNLIICDIDETTVNQQRIEELRKINSYPIYSFQYLLSKAYDHVITNHKMTLLLHIIEGLYNADKNQLQAEKKEIYNKYPEAKKGVVGDYMAAVHWLCKKYFFNYHKKYACEIMPLLKVTRYKFMTRLAETRNWYSHFLNESKKPLRIVKGRDFIIYFEIVCYMIRLSVIDRMGVPINEGRVQEFYYTVHDWILEILYDTDKPLKSTTYQIKEQWKEFMERLEQLQKEALKNESIENNNIGVGSY
ncbi:hypothetical protein [Laedolimicola intestinihominis]|uniref:ApeA N-terminal domain-containing protein n=1 Tax=Laedolimicola intestinihominis TaxID=3133166 RepID=A0ABV1FGT4_9FIRM